MRDPRGRRATLVHKALRALKAPLVPQEILDLLGPLVSLEEPEQRVPREAPAPQVLQDPKVL